jgi:hypothetical protein
MIIDVVAAARMIGVGNHKLAPAIRTGPHRIWLILCWQLSQFPLKFFFQIIQLHQHRWWY